VFLFFLEYYITEVITVKRTLAIFLVIFFITSMASAKVTIDKDEFDGTITATAEYQYDLQSGEKITITLFKIGNEALMARAIHVRADIRNGFSTSELSKLFTTFEIKFDDDTRNIELIPIFQLDPQEKVVIFNLHEKAVDPLLYKIRTSSKITYRLSYVGTDETTRQRIVVIPKQTLEEWKQVVNAGWR